MAQLVFTDSKSVADFIDTIKADLALIQDDLAEGNLSGALGTFEDVKDKVQVLGDVTARMLSEKK